MRLLPWIERSETPKGGRVDRVYGLRLEVTWLELRAWWRKLRPGRRRRKPTEPIAPAADADADPESL